MVELRNVVCEYIYYTSYQCCSGTRSSIPDPVHEPDFLVRDRIAIQFEKPWIGTVRIDDSLRIFRTNPITKIEAICLYAFSIIYATTGPQVYTVVSNGGCQSVWRSVYKVELFT